MSWPVSNEYIYKICKAREMHRHYIQADTLLFICYCWRSKFKMKIDMKMYFRYKLFCSPWSYFWCMAVAWYERAPNISCPDKSDCDVSSIVIIIKKNEEVELGKTRIP